MTSRTPPWHVHLLAAVGLLALSSCGQAKFYAQAIGGQVKILSRRVPVDRVLADPHTDTKLRGKLELTKEIRDFAIQHLQLPGQTHYDTYADLGRPHAVWVVFAAPEFSTAPKMWWYPVVGKLDYQGYFAEKDALTFAAKLKRQGLDVVVGGVDAYSTLGVFRDPLLNTFIHDPDIELAELLFHELTHQKYFRSGSTSFNEAFATATAQEGVRRWLKFHRRWADLRNYEQLLREEGVFVRHVLELRQNMKRLYAATASQPLEQRRAAKATAFAQFQRKCLSLPELRKQKGYRKWFTQPLNNARLNTVSAYHTLVPAFQSLLRQANGDLAIYFQQVREYHGPRQETDRSTP